MASNAHDMHVDNVAVLGTNFGCVDCHSDTVSDDATISAFGNHTDGFYNVVYTGGSTYTYASKTCNSVYCHSDGKSSYENPPSWGSATNLDCKGCHGTSTSYGEPDYQNTGAGATNANSHDKHATSAATCEICHLETTLNGVVINSGSTSHLNNSIQVIFNAADAGASAAYTYATKTCSSISCHGNAQWGASLTCRDCHGDTADDDNFQDDSTPSKIDTTTDWTTTGHGRPSASGTYTNGNPAADFDKSSEDGCLWCHDDTGVAHDVATNPFRLRGYDASFTGYEWNGACLVCHDSDNTAAYQPDGSLTSMDRSGIIKINKVHKGASHVTNNGGKFCWDCHDPHGDDNIAMIHDKTAYKTDGTYGNPGNVSNLVGTTIVFTSNATGAAAGGFAMQGATYAQGLCNGCHTDTGLPYRNNAWDGAHSTDKCTGCHSHDSDKVNDENAFEGAGACTDCHGGATGGVRQITGTGGDFLRGSRHVSDGTTTNEIVTVFDCTVCHLEGIASDAQESGGEIGAIDPDYHNAGTKSGDQYDTDLRNVDDYLLTALAWNPNDTQTTTTMDAMDTFCMNCHDTLGASDIAVANGDPPADPWILVGSAANTTARANGAGKNTNLRPFNQLDTLQNIYDTNFGSPTIGTFRSTTYGRVLNVRKQFNWNDEANSAWASHHNLNQFAKRYDTRNTTAWPNTAWTSYTTKEGVLMTSGSGGELAGLHCSDCHLNEVNAHGSANSWYMLVGKNIASDDDVAPTTGVPSAAVSLPADENVCFRCHNTDAYTDKGSANADVRYDHGEACAGSAVDGAVSSGPPYYYQFPFGNKCGACHGGFGDRISDVVNAAGALGSIHGNNERYVPGIQGTATIPSKRYRFMSGATMRFYDPTLDAPTAKYATTADWYGDPSVSTKEGVGCYTIGPVDTWAGECSQHPIGKESADVPAGKNRTLDY